MTTDTPPPAIIAPAPAACDALDFNQDGDYPTPADVESFIAANAGQLCATCSPDLDFNNDGDFPTPQDIEDFARVAAGGPCTPPRPRDADGWPVYPEHPTAPTLYVSARGTDAAAGTYAAPLASFAAALARIPDGSPGRVRVLAEHGPIAGPIGNQYGGIDQSGASPTYPLVIESWPPTAPRAVVVVPRGRWGVLIQHDRPVRHVAIVGIEFRAQRTDGAPCVDCIEDSAPDAGLAVRVFGSAQDIALVGVAALGLGSGVQIIGQGPFRAEDVTLYRVAIQGGDNTGHAGGIYATSASVAIEDSTIDAAGWRPSRPDSASIFEHNIYARSDARLRIAGLWSSRAAATAVQLRGGVQIIDDSAAVLSPIGITAGHAQAADLWRGTIAGCVVVGGRDIGREPRGFGLGVSRTDGGAVVDNIIGPMLGGSARAGWWIAAPIGRAPTLAGNITTDPAGRFVRDDGGGIAGGIDPTAGTNRTATSGPDISVRAYLQSLGIIEPDEPAAVATFAARAVANRRGAWDARFTARAYVAWARQQRQEATQ